MSNSTETVAKLFEDAIALERAAETLYEKLGGMFANYPEVALFWRHYADEENGHASYLERVRAGVGEGRLVQPANEDMLRKVRDCLEQASPSRLGKVKTLEDAYQLAHELENSETNAIFEFIILNFATDELAKSHSFLRTQLNTHIARLENDFPNLYKSRTARQKVLAGQ